MSLDQELEGQRRFKAIVRAHAPDALAEFGEASSGGRYPVTILRGGRGKSARLYILEDELADLAKDGGGRRADIEARIKQALGEG